jgi:RNA polymerase sigma-70 factor (ECF subfamily)
MRKMFVEGLVGTACDSLQELSIYCRHSGVRSAGYFRPHHSGRDRTDIPVVTGNRDLDGIFSNFFFSASPQDATFVIVFTDEIPPHTTSSINPERWVDEHGDCLYRYALVRVRTREVAEDLVQETFLAALRSLDNYAGRASERTWLCGILKNKIGDYYRKLGRETNFTDMDSLSDEFSEKFVREGWFHATGPMDWKAQPEEVTHSSEFWAILRSCLEKLPAKIAKVFILREVDGIPTEEICKTMAIKDNNLWVMLHRGRMGLRECLERNWFKR